MKPGRAIAPAGLVALVAAAGTFAQTPATLDPIVVTATRTEQRSFDLPVAIDSVDGTQIQQDQLQVNLSESLVRVPGISVVNRWNYAQDLQVSVRGFGARANFGVHGVRLYQDGIPATMPDGQGQTGELQPGFGAAHRGAPGPVLHALRQRRRRRHLAGSTRASRRASCSPVRRSS